VKKAIVRLTTAGRYGDTKAGSEKVQSERRLAMLWTIAVILLILWVLGLVTSYTIGGFVHILLVLAIIVVIFGFLQGRRS
jgi:hypothetical protein